MNVKKIFLCVLSVLLALTNIRNVNAQTTGIQVIGDSVRYLCHPGNISLSAALFVNDSIYDIPDPAITNVDDAFTSIPFNIGFPFTFYGNTYTQCILTGNDVISFNLANAGQICDWNINLTGGPLPNGNVTDVLNAIMCPWQDLYPGAPMAPISGSISSATIGTAPNRIFVVSFCSVPMYSYFSCPDLYFSGETMLYEGSNIIQFHILDKPICTAWNNGQAILGCQNATGTNATIINGYNAGVQWAVSDSAWQLTPNGATDYIATSIPYSPIPIISSSDIYWYDNNNNIVGVGDSITFNVQQTGPVHVQFSSCFGNGTIGGGGGTADSLYNSVDSVFIIVDTIITDRSRVISACYNVPENELISAFPVNSDTLTIQWVDSTGAVVATHNNIINADTLFNVTAGGYIMNVIKPSGCIYSFPYQMPQRTIVASFSYLPVLNCQYDSVFFTNNSTGSITDNFWDFDYNTEYSYDVSPSYNYLYADSYQVVLTVTNDTFSCVFRDTAMVHVHPNIIADYTSSQKLCAGDYIYLYDNSYPYPINFQWYINDSLISNLANPFTVFNNAGDYTLKYIVIDSLCGTDTIINPVTIYPYPIVNLGMDTFLCPGETITLDAGNPGMNYSWSSGEVTQVINPQLFETATISVEVDNNGCIRSDDITVNMNCYFYFPTAFSPNGDGRNDFFVPRLVNMLSYTMVIYNRWGTQIFNVDNGIGNPDEGWDGTAFNEPAPVGVYVYFAKGKTIKGQDVQTQGCFTIIR